MDECLHSGVIFTIKNHMACRVVVGLQIVMLSERHQKEKPHSSLLGRILHRADEGRSSVS